MAAAAAAAGVSVVVKPAWFPTQTCNDFEGDPGQNCLKCNGIDTACDMCLAGNYLSGKICRKVRAPAPNNGRGEGGEGYSGGRGQLHEAAELGRPAFGPWVGLVCNLHSSWHFAEHLRLLGSWPAEVAWAANEALAPAAPPMNLWLLHHPPARSRKEPPCWCRLSATAQELPRPYPADTSAACPPLHPAVQCKDALCLHCGPLDSPCNRCLGVVKSDPYSYSNPGYPTYRDALGRCKRVSAAAPAALAVVHRRNIHLRGRNPCPVHAAAPSVWLTSRVCTHPNPPCFRSPAAVHGPGGQHGLPAVRQDRQDVHAVRRGVLPHRRRRLPQGALLAPWEMPAAFWCYQLCHHGTPARHPSRAAVPKLHLKLGGQDV